jgi:hypothetical protein
MLNTLQRQQLKLGVLSNALMTLTSVHHIYGAIIYHTPWRLHILYLSVPVIILTLLLGSGIKNGRMYGRVPSLIYLGVILLCSVLLIGVFEGLYNHLLKNILYFTGVSQAMMDQLFAVGLYELPNDFIFEMTGIAQGVLAILLIARFIRLIKLYFSNPVI